MIIHYLTDCTARIAKCILIGILLSFALSSCEPHAQMKWSTTEEGYSIWCAADSTKSYAWDGETIGNLINGRGTLTVTTNSGAVVVNNISAYYGAQSKSDALKISQEEFYIGSTSGGKYAGYAALVKGEDVYIGNFYEGKPSGSLTLYRSGKVYYSGQWKNGTFDGDGTLYKEDGTVKSGIWEKGTLISSEVEIETEAGKYEGTIFNGRPDGFGKLSYRNGTEYEGNWKNGEWNGVGQYVAKNDTVISDWINGKANGTTICVFGDYSYEGEFSNDHPNGSGSLYCLNADTPYIYSGEWENGLRHGYGDAVYSNGDSYFGEWKEDAYNGIGRYRYANGDIYDGDWVNNLPSGKGQYLSPAFKYGGEWLDGWIHGFGRIDFPNGDIYEGDFCEGKKCGQGLYQYASGNVYEGEFYDDNINGLGVFTFADGNRYEGEFLNGKIYGNGTLYYADSTGIVTLTAFWDKPNEFPSEASIVFPNGDCYEGPLSNGEPTSEGVWHIIDRNDGKTKIIDKLSGINDYYKLHRETFNKVVMFASFTLMAVGFVVPMGSVASAFIGFAGQEINNVDMGVAVFSAGIDLATAETKEEKIVAARTLSIEIAVNVALKFAPKALGVGPVKSIQSRLSTSATKAARKSIVKLSKNRAIGKVVSVVINKEKKLVLSLEKSAIGKKFFRITGRPEYQYVSNSQYKKVIRNNKVKPAEFNPEAIGDGGLLGANARQYMSIKAVRRYNAERRIMGARRAQWHHVIAGNKSNAAAEGCRQILKRFKIDINDPRNAILLPVDPRSTMRGTIHGKHINSYDEYVLNRLKQAVTPEQCLEVMDDIKKELYQGHLQLLMEHRVNTALRTVTRKSMF